MGTQDSPLVRLASSVEAASALAESLRADAGGGRLPSYCPVEAFGSRRYLDWLDEAAESLRRLDGESGERTLETSRSAFLTLERVLRAAKWLLAGERIAWSGRSRGGVVDRDERVGVENEPAREAVLKAGVARCRSLAQRLRELPADWSDEPLVSLLGEIDLAEAEIYDRSTHHRDLTTPILADAVRRGAAEIRIQPDPWRSLLEYRFADAWRPMFELAAPVARGATIRLKLLTNTMDITERKKPQEGELQAAGSRFALRIEPTRNGDLATIRVLTR
jgi:type II secretory ATPase GspE/PulE/Tfp pilus assembly ATPase PilB-like protein